MEYGMTTQPVRRTHRDGPVFEAAQRRLRASTGLLRGQATDVDAADLDARQDAIRVGLADRDQRAARTSRTPEQRTEHEPRAVAPQSRDTQRPDRRRQLSGYGHRVVHLRGRGQYLRQGSEPTTLAPRREGGDTATIARPSRAERVAIVRVAAPIARREPLDALCRGTVGARDSGSIRPVVAS